MGKIETISVLMPLICTVLATEAKNTNLAYITFFMMLSALYIDLLSPIFTDDDEIDSIFNRALEIIILHEGLYPISESLIVWHQLLDIIPHIKKFGPLRGWWEFFGERSLFSIKSHVPKGGASYDKKVMISCSQFENHKTRNAYCFSVEDIYDSKGLFDRTNFQKRLTKDINNKHYISVKSKILQYSDEKFLLLEKIESKRLNFSDMLFNEFELSCLLDEILIEIKKQCRSVCEASYKSPIFRMYLSYKFHKHNENFNCFLKFLFYCIDESTEFYKIYAKDRSETIYKDNNYLYWNDVDFTVFINVLPSGIFMKEDLVCVKRVLFNFAPYRFSEAIVFGELMNSRGIKCAELEPTIKGMCSNSYNELKNFWTDVQHLSSWFKYRYSYINFQDEEFGFNNKHDKFLYGQFNYFFRLFLPEEQLLHGLPMASAVCRTYEVDKYLNTVSISSNESILNQKLFVCLTNVVSTKLMIGGRDFNKMPIKLKKNYKTFSEAAVRKFSECGPKEAHDLYILEMSPHRKSLVFDKENKNYNKMENKTQTYI
jgi:hypothetical protein